MSIFLTAGAVEKLLNGQVKSESQVKPVLQVWDARMVVRPDRPELERAGLWLTDGTQKIRAVLFDDLASLVRDNTVGFGSIIQLLEFKIHPPPNHQLARSVHILQMKLIVSSSDITGQPKQEYDVVLSSSGSEFVPDSQESYSGKPLILDEFKEFSNKVKAANVFVLDTRTTKDGIRAVIWCFDQLINTFDRLVENLSSVRLKKTESRPSNERSEELTKDQLRSNACELIQFFIRWNVPQLLKAFRSTALEFELRNIQLVVHQSGTLIHKVRTQGFNGLEVKDADFDWKV